MDCIHEFKRIVQLQRGNYCNYKTVGILSSAVEDRSLAIETQHPSIPQQNE